MISSIRHTGLVVSNLENSIIFWRDHLGFKIEKCMDESGSCIDAMLGLHNVEVTTVKLRAPDGGVVELLNFKSHPDVREWTGAPYSTGFTHIALNVSNLDELCENLRGAGVVFHAAPQLSNDGSVRAIYCKGPEGILRELVELMRPKCELHKQ